VQIDGRGFRRGLFLDDFGRFTWKSLRKKSTKKTTPKSTEVKMLHILGPQIKSIQAKEKSTEKSTGPWKTTHGKSTATVEEKPRKNPQRNPQPKNQQKNPLRNPREIYDEIHGPNHGQLHAKKLQYDLFWQVVFKHT
jgi:hypothetical protein